MWPTESTLFYHIFCCCKKTFPRMAQRSSSHNIHTWLEKKSGPQAGSQLWPPFNHEHTALCSSDHNFYFGSFCPASLDPPRFIASLQHLHGIAANSVCAYIYIYAYIYLHTVLEILISTGVLTGSTEKEQFCSWEFNIFLYYLQLQHWFKKMLFQNHLPHCASSFQLKRRCAKLFKHASF